MAFTISGSFEKFKKNLEITNLQENVVSTRQNSVRDVIKASLNLYDSFLTGSYRRNTMISPLKDADVDVFVVLYEEYFYRYNDNKNGGQSALLNLVRNTLRRTYTRTPEISRNGQAVTITFEDFIVDVVPAFNRKGGGYLIPNSTTSSWIATNPKVHIEVMSKANAMHNGYLIPIVKMIKAWNRNIGKPFVSFYLELLAIQIFSSVSISDYPSGIRYFFDTGREKIKYKVKDPVEYGVQISGFNNVSTIFEAVKRFETAYSQAINAEFYEAKGDTVTAIEKWRNIFGSYFPAYG